jgi:uncharacterized RDD family membrane protein YckC
MTDRPDLLPAGLPRRLGAMLYDTLLVLALAMLTLYPLMIMTDGNLPRPAVQSLVFVETFAFFAFFWTRRGQTAGMLAWRLRVQSLDGHGLTLRQALLRFIGATLSFATLGIGYLWMLIDPGRRTWPDMLSATEVFLVRAKSDPASQRHRKKDTA